MSTPVLVEIIAAPIACEKGVKDSWREVASWTAKQLKVRYGESVKVNYYDLFDTNCPLIPAGAHLPVVLVNSELLSSGGKISLPEIRKRIEAIQGGYETIH